MSVKNMHNRHTHTRDDIWHIKIIVKIFSGNYISSQKNIKFDEKILTPKESAFFKPEYLFFDEKNMKTKLSSEWNIYV